MQARAAQAQLRLDLALELPAPLTVMLDRGKFGQVLLNLRGNAIKFSPTGGRVQMRARVDVGPILQLSVEDEGPGIAADELALLFPALPPGRERRAARRHRPGAGAVAQADAVARGGTQAGEPARPGHAGMGQPALVAVRHRGRAEQRAGVWRRPLAPGRRHPLSGAGRRGRCRQPPAARRHARTPGLRGRRRRGRPPGPRACRAAGLRHRAQRHAHAGDGWRGAARGAACATAQHGLAGGRGDRLQPAARPRGFPAPGLCRLRAQALCVRADAGGAEPARRRRSSNARPRPPWRPRAPSRMRRPANTPTCAQAQAWASEGRAMELRQWLAAQNGLPADTRERLAAALARYDLQTVEALLSALLQPSP